MHTVDAYAEWAPHYPPRAHNALMEVEERATLALLPPVHDQVALDAGCGTGRYARLLSQRGARTVIGVDLSSAMLRFAHSSWNRVVGDLRALPFAASRFDVVVSGLALVDIPELPYVAGEFRRVLVPGGVVVYSTLHPNGAELGWTRTFETPHGTRSLPAYWHALNEHRDACAAAGLVIEHVLEPALDVSHPRNPRTSVALVIRARRAGC